ncbi:MAG: HAMP domain-containing histidine kinase [Clostridiales bacterium]|jgi:signal transduction histidine kinase|nr:HAMP domain-containing histidine kinase [Clostridiales bacterium]
MKTKIIFAASFLFFAAAGVYAANRASGRVLARYGYTGTVGLLDFNDYAFILLCAAAFALLLTVSAWAFFIWDKKRRQKRVANLTEYLRQMNAGEYALRPGIREDELSPLEDEIYKTVLLLREGRDRAQAEKERLAQNLSDIAHQLKTPLAAIGLMAELLAEYAGEMPAGLDENSSGSKQGAYIARIFAQTERLNGLASALLTLSRLDAGTLLFEKKPVDVQEMIASAAEAILPMAGQKSQKLILPENEASYRGDFRWSCEAFTNLLKNAVEHTPEGGVIEIKCAENPVCVTITVEDNGEGFLPEDLPRLFTRFYRGKNAGKDSAGIGLALAKAVIEGQNGEIRAENRREGGARFIIKIYRN